MKYSLQSARVILGHACLLLAWIIPDQVPPWSTYYHELLMVIGVLILAPLRHLEVFPWRILVLMILWMVCILLQMPLHDLPRDDIAFGLIFAVLFGVVAQQGAQATSAGSGIQSLAYSIRSWYGVILVAASLSSIIGLAQWARLDLGLWMTESAGRAYANFGQPNHFATLLVMAVAALLYFDGRGALNRLVVMALGVLLCCALAVSESRTGALSLALLCLLVMVFGRRAGLAHTLQWLLPCFFLFLVTYINLDRIAPLVGGTALRTGVGLSPTGRFELWSQMLWSVGQQPWAGFGWLHLGSIHFAAASVFSSIQNVDHAHNIFLDLMIWFGMPLAGALVIGAGIWCVSIAIPAMGSKISKNSLCYVAVILPIAVHSMLEYPYAYLYFSLTLGFFAGALEAEVRGAMGFSENAKKIYLYSFFSVVVVCILIAVEYSAVEIDYRSLRLENQFFTRDEERHTYHASPRFLTQYGKLIASQRNDAHAPEESLSPEVAYEMAKRFPWLSTHLHYYLTLIQQGRCQEAAEQWKVYEVLFGPFGLLTAQGQIEKRGLQTACPASRPAVSGHE
ncbi:hypothetical protein C8236_18795 [Paracidovorax avenae]|nr:hypothetical protein C8236_18795 [Paracidovorax avenae]